MNRTFQEKLHAWMEKNNSTRWSVGCHMVQWQINTQFHHTVQNVPYVLMFRQKPRIGISNLPLDNTVIDNLHTEAQLHSVVDVSCPSPKLLFPGATLNNSSATEDGGNGNVPSLTMCLPVHTPAFDNASDTALSLLDCLTPPPKMTSVVNLFPSPKSPSQKMSDTGIDCLGTAVAAAANLLNFGSDVCNAFAEAPPPKQGFYIRPDRAFNEWWVNFKRHPPISPGHVILWEKHTDAILRDLGLTPTVHEPCLYSGVINGKCIVFMHQVDDFAIAAPDQHTSDILMDLLDEQLTMPIKRQGLLDMFNGVNVVQARHYIKILHR